MKKVLVMGYIVRGPLGGLVFHHLQYLIGLKRMGYEVLFLEDSEEYPACYHPQKNRLTEDPAYGLQFLQAVFSSFDLEHEWAYFDYHQNRWYGRSERAVKQFCERAELLLNLSGANPVRSWTQKIPHRIYLDTDPVFTQLHNLQKTDFRERCDQHTHWFSFGENIGRPGCLVPADGFQWIPTRQPVVPDIWPQLPIPTDAPLTTVMQWNSYATLQYGGQKFGMKSDSFEPYWELPQGVEQSLCLAIGGERAPLDRLRDSGWSVEDAQKVTASTATYQSFIVQSAGEWSIAKHGYVVARSGWFSERSCAYLASGRPVIVEDTGFPDFLPNRGGIWSFSNREEAEEALHRVKANLAGEQSEAKAIIEEYFDFRKVLTKVVEQL